MAGFFGGGVHIHRPAVIAVGGIGRAAVRPCGAAAPRCPDALVPGDRAAGTQIRDKDVIPGAGGHAGQGYRIAGVVAGDP